MTDRIRSRPLHFVSCTKGSKDDTLLHPSLSKLGIDSCTFFEFDTVGLSKRYNEVLDAWRGRDEIVVFARDDISVCDVFIADKLNAAADLHGFSVVGCAGASTVDIAQGRRPTVWQSPEAAANSGAVERPTADGRQICEVFGPTPSRCIVMDGLLLAVDLSVIGDVRFDEQFQFHFYDLYFCLSADQACLVMGTVNVKISRGSVTDDDLSFETAQAKFREKWSARGIKRRSVCSDTISLETPATRAAYHAGPMKGWLAALSEVPVCLPTSAWSGHIPFLSLLMHVMRPRNFVELGVDLGASFLAACTFAERSGAERSGETSCTGVDTWAGDEHAGIWDGSRAYEGLRAFVETRFKAARLLRSTFSDALPQFDTGSIDLLHVDGLHTYDAVLMDFTQWLPKMSNRGVILFHDTIVQDRGFGVWKLWGEVRQRYRHIEFDHSYGLGVLVVGSDPSPSLREMLDYVEGGKGNERLLKNFCAAFGASLPQRMERMSRYVPNEHVELESKLVRGR